MLFINFLTWDHGIFLGYHSHATSVVPVYTLFRLNHMKSYQIIYQHLLQYTLQFIFSVYINYI